MVAALLLFTIIAALIVEGARRSGAQATPADAQEPCSSFGDLLDDVTWQALKPDLFSLSSSGGERR